MGLVVFDILMDKTVLIGGGRYTLILKVITQHNNMYNLLL